MINIEEEILCTLDKNHVIKSWLCHMIDFLKIKCKFPIFSFSFSLDIYWHIKSISINAKLNSTKMNQSLCNACTLQRYTVSMKIQAKGITSRNLFPILYSYFIKYSSTILTHINQCCWFYRQKHIKNRMDMWTYSSQRTDCPVRHRAFLEGELRGPISSGIYLHTYMLI